MRPSHVFLLLAVLVMACEESSVGPEFPRPEFREGAQWTYIWEVYQEDTAGVALLRDRDSILVQVISVNTELDTVTGLICVEARSLMRTQAGSERVWYRQSGEALEEVAYKAASMLPVIHMRQANGFSFHAVPSILDPVARWSHHLGADSMLWREDPRVVLRYPLVVGSRWTAFTLPFLQTREVLEVSEKILPNGMASRAATISTTNIQFGPQDSWIDIVSTAGMISRSIRLIVEMTDENMNPLGTVEYSESFTLVSMSG